MNFIITGKVIKGDGYGKKLGFPTVNLDTESRAEVLPPPGVYSGNAILKDKKYRAGIVIGPKIDFQQKVEAHLIGYDGDAYGDMVTLEVKNFLRVFKKFNTEKELIEQIEKDLKKC